MSKIKFEFQNNGILVSLPFSISPQNIKCVIDSAAELSIIRPNKILTAKINTLKRIQIIGVVKNQTIRSMGTVKTQINFNNLILEHEFHVINQNLNLNADAVIGNDFLVKNNALIDYLDGSLTVKITKNNTHDAYSKSSEPRIISSFSTKKDTCPEINACSEYHKALSEWDHQITNKQSIHMISEYKTKNKAFYEELSDSFFDNYEEIKPSRVHILQPLTNVKTLTSDETYNHAPSGVITDRRERMEYLLSKFELGHLNNELKGKIADICYEFSDAFYIEGDKLEPTNAYVHSIKLRPNIDVVHVKQYRIPENHKVEIDRQVKDLEEKRIIEKSTSRFNSPLLLVKKAPDKTGSPQFRLVLDFRKLNEATIPQAYPIPLIDEIIDQMDSTTCFTKLDVQSAFHQILLDEKCRHLTAFSTTFNHYQFRTVPFGLQSAPVAWLYTITRVLQKCINRNLFTYMDDIVLVNQDIEGNLQLLRRVLKQLIRYNLKLKPEKCSLLQTSIKYLGFKLSKNGVEVDENKTACIRQYPRPKNVVEIQRFLGFVNFYRKHIYDFSRIARPLYDLCKKDNEFVWANECELAFNTLRIKLMNPPILVYPRFEYPFIITSDASKVAIAAILSNKIEGEDRPIQYFSKTLNKAQRNYSTIELELFAIIASIRHWSCYLHNKFYVFTDHKPIEYLFNSKHNSSRIHRWRLELLEFQFEVAYKKGKLNVCADALSRIEIKNDPDIEEKLKSIFLVTTRSRSENSMNTVNSSNKAAKPQTKDKINSYYVQEKSNFVFTDSNFDHIFFCVDKPQGKVHKQIQHKLKKKIDLNDLKYGELVSIDKNRSAILITKLTRTESEIEKTFRSLQMIHAFVVQHAY